ncbi:hypothetical protein AcV7_003010 [Taiwanofungus camphoratus]|nr:hypothetical protein AcV7_003010 [Antrodia cinnamomea]
MKIIKNSNPSSRCGAKNRMTEIFKHWSNDSTYEDFEFTSAETGSGVSTHPVVEVNTTPSSPRSKTTFPMGVDGSESGGMLPRLKADFSPSTDVWYANGSVVLVAEKTAFRVHGTIVAAHFKDMFAMPQPGEPDSDTEMYETCQVLRLQDSAADLKHFLKSIYDFSYFRPGVKTKFPVVAAVLRLSTKYHAAKLRHRAINLLATAYPCSLAAWENRSLGRLVPPFEGEHGAYIALAIENDIRAILPAVYYAASRQPLSDVLNELRSLDVSPSMQWEITSDFILGRERLLQAEMTHILAFLDPNFARPGCRDPGRESNYLNGAARTGLSKVADAYHHWCSANPGKVGKSLGLCDSCCATVEHAIKEGREKVWNQLPRFFGLPDWDTLKARDEVELCT